MHDPWHGDRRRAALAGGALLAAALLWGFQAPVSTALARVAGLGPSAARLLVTLVPLLVLIGLLVRVLIDTRRPLDEARRIEELARSELARAQELRDTFLQGVSHELRTPLTIIVGFAATLQKHADRLSPDEVVTISQRLSRNALKLERHVLGLVDVEGMTDRHARGTTPEDLSALVLETIERIDTGTHDVSVDISGGHAQLRIDRDRIERLVEELVGNALRHTAPGSRVRVTVSADDRAVVLMVDDDGAGVDDISVELVFHPFHQALDERVVHAPGLGIGLTLVDRYARMHGGHAWCETSPLGGARFGVRFPLHGDRQLGRRDDRAPAPDLLRSPDGRQEDDT